MLTPEEKQRYDRQMMVSGIGEAGQEKLKKAHVVIAGSGGLGSPIALYLTAAGVGTLRIIDNDKVELSNLNRQILHWGKDVGKTKTASAYDKLSKLNKNVIIETVHTTIDESNVSQLTEGFDVIVDAMDNLLTRFLLNKAAIEHHVPFVHGAVSGLEGRAMTVIPGKSACLKCIYHSLPPEAKFPVLGTTPAVIGAIEATEVIKYITGIGTLLTDRLLIYDGLNMKFTELKVIRNTNCEHCGDAVTGK
ncbi:MAG TPA: HesA/MoeB/ThiF family protein [Dehalococcoidales bacterium]|jgi:adenylyltransferase/sulfurtransferase|nr:HesA/MoeB/ThiF family protein [Dehalococcoidales bacterium]